MNRGTQQNNDGEMWEGICFWRHITVLILICTLTHTVINVYDQPIGHPLFRIDSTQLFFRTKTLWRHSDSRTHTDKASVLGQVFLYDASGFKKEVVSKGLKRFSFSLIVYENFCSVHPRSITHTISDTYSTGILTHVPVSSYELQHEWWQYRHEAPLASQPAVCLFF